MCLIGAEDNCFLLLINFGEQNLHPFGFACLDFNNAVELLLFIEPPLLHFAFDDLIV